MSREKLFTAVARFAQLKPETGNKKSPVYRDTQRNWFLKYSHEIFRNIHLEYIQSDNDKNGRNNINGRSLRSGFVQKGIQQHQILVSYVRLSLSKHTCVCYYVSGGCLEKEGKIGKAEVWGVKK